MKILVLGGDASISSPVVNTLLSWGHDVTDVPGSAIADGSMLELRSFYADVVVDLDASSVQWAELLLDMFDIPGRRIVLASSIDVYRASARFDGTEPGEPELVPILEGDPTRDIGTSISPGQIKARIEELVRSARNAYVTILRLPAIYGERAPNQMLVPALSPMLRGESEITLNSLYAEWRCASAYAPDTAYAIALAAKNSKSAGKIYNIADSFVFTRLDWVNAIARAANWGGKIVISDNFQSPATCDFNQHLIVDSSAIRQDLGYMEQTPINDAIAAAVDWETAAARGV